MATGSKFGRITPADGLAFLTSAINLIGPPQASGVKKSRTGGASASLPRKSASETAAFARSISARFVATILSRIVGMDARRVGTAHQNSPHLGGPCPPYKGCSSNCVHPVTILTHALKNAIVDSVKRCYEQADSHSAGGCLPLSWPRFY